MAFPATRLRRLRKTGVLRDLTGTQQAGMWVVGGVMVLAALLVVALRAAPRPSDD